MKEKVKLEFLDRAALNFILKQQSIYLASGRKIGESADLSASIIEEFDFSGIDLSSIFAIGSIFIRCKFINCELYGAVLDESQFINANFRGANLGKTNFYQVKAKNVCFDNTNCGSAEFDEADLNSATFRNANLNGASFVDCDLSNAIFDGAKLTNLSTGGANKWNNTSLLNITGENPVPES